MAGAYPNCIIYIFLAVFNQSDYFFMLVVQNSQFYLR